MILREKQAIGGVLTLELRNAGGAIVERRRVHNLITRAGRKLLADLLMGRGGISVPVQYRIAVGTGKSPESANDEQLEARVDASETLPPEVVVVAETDSVRATVTGTLEKLNEDTVQPLTEAGIEIDCATGEEGGIATTLFNRVTFAEVNRGPGMTLTLSWEISF